MPPRKHAQMASPPPPPPTQPATLAPAQVRQRRAEQRALLTREQAAGRLPTPPLAPSAPSAPSVATSVAHPDRVARKRFHTQEVRRVPVQVTPEADAVIHASSAQGRLLPLALAEAFGMFPLVTRLSIALEPKRIRFVLHPSEIHPLTGAEPLLLVITAYHTETAMHEWLINSADLSYIDPQSHLPRFLAAELAFELARLYPYRTGVTPFTATPILTH